MLIFWRVWNFTTPINQLDHLGIFLFIVLALVACNELIIGAKYFLDKFQVLSLPLLTCINYA